MPEQTEAILLSWVIPILTAILGFLAAFLLEKFKNRIVLLKFKKDVFQLGTSIRNNFWGNIEVLYNNRKTNHLSLITIEIKNDSNIDLENVNVDFWVDNESQILAHQSNYIESGNLIMLEKIYQNEVNKVIELNEIDKQLKIENENYQTPGLNQRTGWILKNKKFNLSVFNRNTSVKFQLLVENFQGLVPVLSLSILHKSCKLIPEIDETEIIKARNRYVGWIWIILACLSTLLIYLKFQKYQYASIWTGILSIVTLYLSFGIFFIIRSVRRVWR